MKEAEGFGLAGQIIGRINNMPSVQEIFDGMILIEEKGLSRKGYFIREQTLR